MALTAQPAAASSLIIGDTTQNGGNGFPFNSTFGTRYQQVYSSGEFSEAVTISELFFIPLTDPSDSDAGTRSVIISLSSTSALVDALSSTFNNNLGANNTIVFSGPLPTLTPGENLVFSLATPFNYDPTSGQNLLIDMQFGGTGSYGTQFGASNGTAGGAFSRRHNFGTEFAGWGLTTGFTFGAPIPEPATWMMLVLGFGLIGGTMRAAKRRQKLSVSYAG
ncbi:MAG: PEPxxWA-CTERM sorting domain-containing protein [Pseudomonadota bacterium]